MSSHVFQDYQLQSLMIITVYRVIEDVRKCSRPPFHAPRGVVLKKNKAFKLELPFATAIIILISGGTDDTRIHVSFTALWQTVTVCSL